VSSPAPVLQAGPGVVPAAMREVEPGVAESKGKPDTSMPAERPETAAATPASLPSSGTVVLDVEQGGIVVPSFAGKSVRAAVETAARNGLDLDVVGSGLALTQEPAAGVHVAAGSRVMVKFGR